MEYLQEISDPILTKLGQLNRNDFQDLVALGTFASYENRVYLAGPCNIGKSSLASILIGEEIPKTWFSTDGLIIHFGRNGIDLQQRKMIPLKKGSGDVLTKLLLGNPELKKQPSLQGESKEKIPGDPKSNFTTKENQLIPSNTNLYPSNQEHMSPKSNQKTSKGFKVPPIHTAHSIQDDLLEKIKKGTNIMNIAPSDLVDFGGQKSFDMTHQLFIQHRGTFILMFDGRKGLYTELEEYSQRDVTAASVLKHWINSVLTYCNKTEDKMPRILFAATHSDSFSEDEKRILALKFNEELRKLFSSHKLQEHILYDKVFFMNATDAADQDIERLKDTLVDIAFQQSTWGQQMPIVWVPLDLQISDMRADGVKLITKERLLDINKSNIEFSLNERRVDDFLLVQHSIGKLLYFDEPALRDFIVIQPTAMVNILRAFITDIMFWPEKGPVRDILENLSSTGVLKKTDLFTLWSQPAFKEILTDVKTKEYIVQVLLHLDILVEPKRYTETDAAADLFLVPCIVKAKIPQKMHRNAKDDRTLCIAYHLKETVVPSALSFKLIGAAISIWPLKVENSCFCLYFQAAIMDADNRNELQIHVEGQRIFAYLINDVSKQLISPDLATTTQECLTLALGRILQFYRRCFGKQSHHFMSDLFEIEVGEICKGKTCLIPLSDAKKKAQWRCENGKMHETKCPLNWVFEKNKKHCDSNCKGPETETLDLKPDNHHFVQLARTIGIGDFYNFFIKLGMEKTDLDNLNFRYFSNPMDFMLMGLFEWRDKTESDEMTATFRKLQTALEAIERQHYLCQVHREDQTLAKIANISLQDVPSNDVISSLTEKKLIGDCIVHLGIELGLSINSIKETIVNNPRTLYGQIHNLLIKWKSGKVKPTIYRLMVALKKVKASEGLAFVMKTYGVEQKYKENLEQKQFDPSLADTKLDFSDILDKMMTQLVISVEDRRSIQQNDDPEKKLLSMMIQRGEPNKSVCIDVLKQNRGYEDLAEKLSDSSSSVSSPTKTELQDVPDYKIRLQKNYLEIINRLKHDQ
ncbi:uncharacterized protein LOC127731938 [Mytilus californianus]|uniref:uncharacterized protein LOC127731938 n=1 Tax=Mytilus californianus TaxID=6549 RepID=UPI002246DF56|nr:uncharacterized protein LOC127731938 [Mytilus californianus]XP_052096777.1 uncharacterized protein LOC127731938 [Mytilus californianus]XP_052096778.1 uncharacterized protein LOC127731938 [Mytilus californianus]XP_052096779.1 uncharacterized protein LOC127731938 [Mytilus californianus]XP_052096781.1 uncharacterized protein LOC127731938 [Mytilus californianus]XP_052096782.1 uncharacterized protein LOC127731938 [Mytilus californianus]XP_052096783.1 uncharacterized protein LOC127731938 [Mytilu